MAITITPKLEEQWRKFSEYGGAITFEIDATDIISSHNIEDVEFLANQLDIGFTLAPTTLIQTSRLQNLINVYGTDWDRIVAFVYSRAGKGNIEYKRSINGKYSAKCTLDIN